MTNIQGTNSTRIYYSAAVAQYYCIVSRIHDMQT